MDMGARMWKRGHKAEDAVRVLESLTPEKARWFLAGALASMADNADGRNSEWLHAFAASLATGYLPQDSGSVE
jgi:hypothetical protein